MKTSSVVSDCGSLVLFAVKRCFHFLEPGWPFLLAILLSALTAGPLSARTTAIVLALLLWIVLRRGCARRGFPDFGRRASVGQSLGQVVQMSAQVLRQSFVSGT